MAFGLECVSRATVYKWFAEFKRGRVELNDDVRSGRPVTASGDDNVADVKRLVEADRRISISCITHELEISTGTVSRILNDFLGLSRISARWVPH